MHGAGDGPLINEWKQLGALASLTIRVGNGTRVGLTADLIQPLTLACSGPCWDFFAALFHSTWGNLCLFFSQVDRPQKSPVREATCIRAAIIICESVTQLPNGRTPAGFLLFIPRRSTCLLSNTFPVDIHSVCLYFYVGLGWFVNILLPLQPKESSFTTDFYFICLFFFIWLTRLMILWTNVAAPTDFCVDIKKKSVVDFVSEVLSFVVLEPFLHQKSYDLDMMS